MNITKSQNTSQQQSAKRNLQHQIFWLKKFNAMNSTHKRDKMNTR